MKGVAVLVLFALAACGTEAARQPAERDERSGAPLASGCDTAIVFQEPAAPDEVLDAMRSGDISPIETRFVTSGGTNGDTVGGVGSPGIVGTVDAVASALDSARELHGGEPRIVGIRVAGDVEAEALGAMADDVHTRMRVPSTASVALTAPGVGEETVMTGGAGGC